MNPFVTISQLKRDVTTISIFNCYLDDKDNSFFCLFIMVDKRAKQIYMRWEISIFF